MFSDVLNIVQCSRVLDKRSVQAAVGLHVRAVKVTVWRQQDYKHFLTFVK